MSILANLFLAHHVNTKAMQVGSMFGLLIGLLLIPIDWLRGVLGSGDFLGILQRACLYGAVYCMLIAFILIAYHLLRLSASTKEDLAHSIWFTQSQMNVDKVSIGTALVGLLAGLLTRGSTETFAKQDISGSSRVLSILELQFLPFGLLRVLGFFFMGMGLGTWAYIIITGNKVPLSQIWDYATNCGMSRNKGDDQLLA